MAPIPKRLRKPARGRRILIAVTASDEVNMVTCQVAKSLFNVPKTIARVRDGTMSGKWQDSLFNRENIPVDVIISPETEVGRPLCGGWPCPAHSTIWDFATMWCK